MAPRVIALAGGIASGKSTVARALATYLECPIISFGDYVRSVAQNRSREPSRSDLQEISEELLLSLGPEGFTRAVLNSSHWDRQTSLVVDGVRHSEVIRALRSEARPLPVLLVYLDVDSRVRAARFAARDDLSTRELAGFDSHSTEQQVGSVVRSLADVIVTSNASVEETMWSILGK